jgi:hypothetical protein
VKRRRQTRRPGNFDITRGLPQSWIAITKEAEQLKTKVLALVATAVAGIGLSACQFTSGTGIYVLTQTLPGSTPQLAILAYGHPSTACTATLAPTSSSSAPTGVTKTTSAQGLAFWTLPFVQPKGQETWNLTCTDGSNATGSVYPPRKHRGRGDDHGDS